MAKLQNRQSKEGRSRTRISARRDGNLNQSSPATTTQAEQQESYQHEEASNHTTKEVTVPTEQCLFLLRLPLEVRRVIYDAVIRLPHTITISEKNEFHFHNQSILTALAQTCSQIKAELHDWLLEIPKEKMLKQGIVNPKKTCSFGPFNRSTTTFLVTIGNFPAREFHPTFSNEKLMRLMSLMRLLRGIGTEALPQLIEGGIGHHFALA